MKKQLVFLSKEEAVNAIERNRINLNLVDIKRSYNGIGYSIYLKSKTESTYCVDGTWWSKEALIKSESC